MDQQMQYAQSVQWTYNEKTLRKYTDDIALERAGHLANTFTQYRKFLNSAEYQVVEPVLPMDVIAAYVFVPKMK